MYLGMMLLGSIGAGACLCSQRLQLHNPFNHGWSKKKNLIIIIIRNKLVLWGVKKKKNGSKIEKCAEYSFAA